MLTSIQVVLEASSAVDPAAFAVASLAASLRTFTEVPVRVTRLESQVPCALSARDAAALVVVWYQPQRAQRYDAFLACLAGRASPPRLAVVGPCLADDIDLEYWRQRLPPSCELLPGEPEAHLFSLLARENALKAASPPWLGDSREMRLPPEWLPSAPQAEDLRVLSSPCSDAFLELARGAVPFSPLPLELQGGAPRLFPKDWVLPRLRALLSSKPRRIRLLPEPMTAAEETLTAVLELLAAENSVSPVALTLTEVPDASRLVLMRRAGVRDLTLLTALGDEEEEGTLLSSADLKRLEAYPFRVRLVLSRHGLGGGSLSRQYNTLRFSCVTQVTPVLPTLWPGHPERRSLLLGGQQAMALQRFKVTPIAPPYVCADPWPEEDDVPLSGIALSPLEWLERYSCTLRFMAKALVLPPSSLLRCLSEEWERGGFEGEASVKDTLTRMMVTCGGPSELTPALGALMSFEAWLWDGRPVARTRPADECPELTTQVLRRMRGFELRVFSYDVLALAEGRAHESPTLGRFPVVRCRARGPLTTALPLTPLGCALLEAVDGRKTGAEVIDLASRRLSPGKRDIEALRVALSTLYLEGMIGVVREKRTPLEAESSAVKKLLPFRRIEPRPEETHR